MVIECGELLISFSDNTIKDIEHNISPYQVIDVMVQSDERTYDMAIKIWGGLNVKNKIQAIIVHTLARLTFDPDRTKDVWPLHYCSMERRKEDWSDGYWECIIGKWNKNISISADSIVGYGLIT